jgi:hypothetical protein
MKWIAALVLALVSLAAQAHKASDAYWTVNIEGDRVTQRLDIALRDLDRELALDADNDRKLTWGEVRTQWGAIEALVAEHVQLRVPERGCTLEHRGAPQLVEHSDGAYAVLTQVQRCGAVVADITTRYTLFAESDPTHRGIAKFTREGTAPRVLVLDPNASQDAQDALFAQSAQAARASATGKTTPRDFVGFVREGMHHIAIGTDHVLFLLALLLPVVLGASRSPDAPPQATLARVSGPVQPAAQGFGPVFREVLAVVTAFTVAHSLTLALAAFDVIDPPSRWVESIIAASVMLAALNNLRPVVQRSRWIVTFAFGLVHGFGFAGALRDLDLDRGDLLMPLFGFNLGVEAGQLIIVAFVLPVIWWLRHTTFYRRVVLQGGSAVIAVVAAVWLVERVLG